VVSDAADAAIADQGIACYLSVLAHDSSSDDVTAPDSIDMPKWACGDPHTRTVMSEIATVGLDLAKNVFQAHGANTFGRVALRKKLRHDQVPKSGTS
jgi:hypothetical protein